MIAVPSLTKGVAQGAGLATRNHSSSTVNVPSELLLQLVDVSRSVQKLLPSSDLKGIAPDGEDQGGYDSLLSLALRHHALLQQRNEDLLTQHARCTAQVEALREDKLELRQQIQEYKLQIRQLIKGEDKHATSIDHIDPSVLDVKTTPAVGFDVDETCSCGENGTLGHRDENGCICGAPTTTTTEEQPSTTETPILGEGVRVKDCAGHQYEGATQSGIYEIYPSECYGVRVWCDLETDGGGWTVFLNRQEQPKQENFTRTWEEYRDGFGDVSAEYWLGNEILHQLTAKDEHVLRVDAEDFNQSRRWGVWERFRVEDEEHNYKLLSVMYSSNSTLGDGLLWHSGMQFSTIDRDNDKHKGSCSDEYKGGWWYNVCHNANPTGILVNSDDFDSVGWVYWSPRQYKWASLRFLQMKLRPKAFGTPDPTSPPRDCASA
ncbi:cell surface pattern recognition receptor signaling pathway [Halocaridina rubra]|uniref:Cell surface pattern recognition receptor signaling pathway n=1 Tax=Halocaridina rubra TaxID=373956 RepID=A0AAN8XFA4_HALRR